MITAIKSELRKVLTVRSTYLVFIIALLINMIVSFWTSGYRVDHALDTHYLQNSIIALISGIGFFVGITPLLLVTHEYRHNLIYYTLTANHSRTIVFLAKLAVIAKYALVFMLANMLFATLAILVGLNLGDHTLPAQQFEWWPLLWRSGFYLLAVSFMAAIFGFVVRNQIGAFVVYLLYPGTVEALIGLLIKKNAGYLPFRAIATVIMPAQGDFSVNKSAVIAAVWVVVGLIVSWLLFLKRDAN
ncbi:hypothetical protein JNM87_04265 [Candidatus Saccharibacteria bacterium]|nr:hypothetical protein [Candidatus Saccharibacteria bacterium]